jgi:hypothetical protein
MTNVVYVDFRSPRMKQRDYMLQRFADMLAERGFDDEDIADVIDGIHDFEYYKTLDDVVRHIVDVWHQHTANL